jgi:hypothetical protein
LGAVFPGFGSRVSAIVAPAGVVTGFVVRASGPLDPTAKSPTATGALEPTITHAV